VELQGTEDKVIEAKRRIDEIIMTNTTGILAPAG
jgi:hypothetical protein